MAASTRRSRWEGIGHATALGLAFAPFALLFSIWIPSFALIFGAVAIAAGSVDFRWASGRQARFGLLPIGLGILAIVVTLVVVALTTTGPASGVANTVVDPP
jgi:MFS superfamily sulfate permease-like transporter